MQTLTDNTTSALLEQATSIGLIGLGLLSIFIIFSVINKASRMIRDYDANNLDNYDDPVPGDSMPDARDYQDGDGIYHPNGDYYVARQGLWYRERG